jgi:hypothetical protein
MNVGSRAFFITDSMGAVTAASKRPGVQCGRHIASIRALIATISLREVVIF